MKIPLSRLGAYDPRKKTISTAVRNTSEQSRLPKSNEKTIPAHLRINTLDGYGTKWVS